VEQFLLSLVSGEKGKMKSKSQGKKAERKRHRVFHLADKGID
jgi:hypothetical protein